MGVLYDTVSVNGGYLFPKAKFHAETYAVSIKKMGMYCIFSVADLF